MRTALRLLIAAPLALCLATLAHAAPLPAGLAREVDAIARETLATSGVPSASVAIVQNGEIAYAQAYGTARPGVRATTETRYAIGSISKQFTAAALLLQVEDGKLSLDDRIDASVPHLTRGRDITIRQVLSHTAGYRDYWPQDFVPGLMQRPNDAQGILTRWARIPLDYEPGAEFRYSNTGFTVAGLIVEKAAGQPLHAVQQSRIFAPLGMTGVTEIDSGPLAGRGDSVGYARFALGALRPAVKEGRGWLWAIGDLAMRPTDLALWNINLMRGGPVLSAASKTAMTTSVTLNNGQPANYGLGLFVRTVNGKRIWTHGGAVSGYLAENRIYPDEGLAITVLTNGEFGGVQDTLAARLTFLLREQPARIAAARDVLAQFAGGRIDRTRFTPNGNEYYTDAVVREIAQTLRGLGPVRLMTLDADRLRGGLTVEVYTLTFATRRATLVARADPATGKYEQFAVDFGA
jgi:CubicO group peptidase (beta-lactamase class C family)